MPSIQTVRGSCRAPSAAPVKRQERAPPSPWDGTIAPLRRWTRRTRGNCATPRRARGRGTSRCPTDKPRRGETTGKRRQACREAKQRDQSGKQTRQRQPERGAGPDSRAGRREGARSPRYVADRRKGRRRRPAAGSTVPPARATGRSPMRRRKRAPGAREERQVARQPGEEHGTPKRPPGAEPREGRRGSDRVGRRADAQEVDRTTVHDGGPADGGPRRPARDRSGTKGGERNSA